MLRLPVPGFLNDSSSLTPAGFVHISILRSAVRAAICQNPLVLAEVELWAVQHLDNAAVISSADSRDSPSYDGVEKLALAI